MEILKNVLLTVLLYIPFNVYATSDTIRLTILISDDLCQEEQTLYWFSLIDNEYDIIDSCMMKEGQNRVEFEKKFTVDFEYINTWLTFSKNGPLETSLNLIKGENVIVYITKETGMYPVTEGSSITKEGYDYMIRSINARKRLDLFTDSLYSIKDKTEEKSILDSINHYKRYLDKGRYYENTQEAKSPRTFLVNLSVLADFEPAEVIDSLISEMKMRFPYSKKVQGYSNRTPSPPATERSKSCFKIYEDIFNSRIKSKKEITDNGIAIQQDIRTLSLNDTIVNFGLKNISGEYIYIDSIKTDYILIDFWAAWCGPCRREFPYLKKVYEKYKENLTIYAISLDNSEHIWKETIEKDQIQIFTHVYGGNMTKPETKNLCKLFGITGIPASFLLDKNRRIIATDLRGEALTNKLEELIVSD